jgi:valyl-tRNA synthetase
MYLDGPRTAALPPARPFPDRWILSRLNHTVGTVTTELEAYRFDRAAGALYQFIWHEYCDWYLEMIKPTLQDPSHPEAPLARQTLVETLETTMRLLHPFMPFITEEIWQTIPHEGASIVIQTYPVVQDDWEAPEAEQSFGLLEQAVGLVRTGRVLLSYPPGRQVDFCVSHDDPARQEKLHALRPYLALLGRGTADVASPSAWPPGNLLRLVTEGLSVGITVAGEVDVKKALDRILKQQEEQDEEIRRLEAKLGSRDFVAKAPPEVITDHRSRVQSLRHDQAMLLSSERQLRAMLGA